MTSTTEVVVIEKATLEAIITQSSLTNNERQKAFFTQNLEEQFRGYYIANDHPSQNYYTITSGGNAVEDPPTISLEGEDPVSITAGVAWTDPGATATGGSYSTNYDGLDVSNPAAGAYTIRYTVTNSAGTAEVTRTVNVQAAAPAASEYGLRIREDTQAQDVGITYIKPPTGDAVEVHLLQVKWPASTGLTMDGCTIAFSSGFTKLDYNTTYASLQSLTVDGTINFNKMMAANGYGADAYPNHDGNIGPQFISGATVGDSSIAAAGDASTAKAFTTDHILDDDGWMTIGFMPPSAVLDATQCKISLYNSTTQLSASYGDTLCTTATNQFDGFIQN